MIDIGDEVVLVRTGPIVCETPVNRCVHQGKGVFPPKIGSVVVGLRPALSDLTNKPMQCGCMVADLSDGTHGITKRYRKVTRDTEPADEEFTALIKEGRYVDI